MTAEAKPLMYDNDEHVDTTVARCLRYKALTQDENPNIALYGRIQLRNVLDYAGKTIPQPRLQRIIDACA